MSAIISTDMPDQKISISSEIKIACNDSLRMNFLAPFGLTAGILYADSTEFRFYNMLENKAFTGSPTKENLSRSINIALDFGELVSLLRSEIPGETGEFRFVESKEDGDLYRNTVKKDLAEFIVFDKKTNSVVRYQQKSQSGTVMLNVYFSEFAEISGEHFAHRIDMLFPALEGSVTIRINSIEKVTAFDSPFKFKIPSNAQLSEFD